MAGKSRWRVCVAPALLGAVLQGGCQTSGGTGAGASGAAIPAAKTAGIQDGTTGGAAGQSSANRDGVVVQTAFREDAAEPVVPANYEQAETATPIARRVAHERFTPTATGALLNMAPGESPVERLSVMTARLDAAEKGRKDLEMRVLQLTTAAEQREKQLQQATREVRDSAEEVQQMRSLAESLRRDLDEIRATLGRRDKDEIETLKAINKLLERLAEQKARPAETDERIPLRPH